jgi:hypothetical protein
MKPDAYDELAHRARTPVSAKSHHHLVEPEAWENLPGQRIIGEYHQGSPANSHKGSKTRDRTDKDKEHPVHDKSGGPRFAKFLKTKVLDVTNMEMISSAIFRTLYGKGIRAPLKLKNVIDMDIAVDNNVVTLNTNNVSFIPPKLEIWRFIFAYKNKPLLEYGKGISGIKVYYGRAFIFGLTLWWVSWKKRWLSRNPRAARALQTYATTQMIGGKPD